MFSRLQKFVLIALTLGAFFVWNTIFTQDSGLLKVVFLDVGQGDATFIETPSGNQVLVDGGYGRKVLSELGRVMSGHDRTIDVLIATHTDSDHLGGLVEVLNRYEVTTVIDNGFKAESGVYKEWERLLVEKNIKRIIANSGDVLDLGEGALLEILSPTENDKNDTSANDVMVVSRLIYGEHEFLLAGDIERGDELALAKSNAELSADVLKVGHHGSKTSSTNLFLKSVAPVYTVVSVGNKNIYGHPDEEVLRRLASLGATIFRTDTDGRIAFFSDGFILGFDPPY
ncbi:MAG: ComEC/Rec2 family competence protein [bacterium]|nr:ComEC/Rec2 family competence protein [bacterium]